jgi:hypothetical protein
VSNETAKTDYDSPWKEILEQYFPQFLAFFLPHIYTAIDWSKDHTFLDKELQQISPESETGSRRVDKLVRVFLLNGNEAWLLIHIEVQGQREEEFPERMYIYNYRLFDLYRRKVVSLAVLTDENQKWRPSHYGYEQWGCRVSLDFPIIKLLDYIHKQEELLVSDNPFAIVVMAHLQTQATRNNPEKRFDAKLNLAKLLYRKGVGRQDILNLFRFIDWIMTLPPELATQLQVELTQFEEREKMQYVTSIERMAIQKGLEKGREEGIRESIVNVLQARFGVVPTTAAGRLKQVDDVEQLQAYLREAATVGSLAELEALLVDNMPE